MAASLTEEEFSKYVGGNFRLKLDQQEIELKLAEVKAYPFGPNEQSGMERFSVFFSGPLDILLAQNIYQLQHETMGEFEIFLVPIARNENGFRYEAVFNYFKT